MINPLKVEGKWDEGYVLDKHVLTSEYIGEDENGNVRFDTKRSELGDCIYRLKYRNDIKQIEKIMDLISPFLDNWSVLNKNDCVIATPPSKKGRHFQPVFALTEAIGDYLDIAYYFDVLEKISEEESKDFESDYSLDGQIIKRKNAKRKIDVLLIDDLYSTGNTLNECTKALKEDENINKVYVLAMTKTRGK